MTLPLASTTRPLPGPLNPLDHYLHGGVAWLHDGAGLVGNGVAASVQVVLPDAVEAASLLLASITVDDTVGVPGTGPVVFAAFPFDSSRPGELVVPSTVVGCNPQGQAWMTTVGPASMKASPPDSVESSQEPAVLSRFTLDGHSSRPRWISMVCDALARIENDEFAKVVVARRVSVTADADFDLVAVLGRLQRDHPTCFTFAVGDFLGASPELLVRRRGALVVSRPMAGTVERGDTLDADQRATEAMATSAKHGHEHRLVVDAVTEALRPWCQEVSASAQPEVARLATVAHLATTVAGRLRGEPPPSALAVVDRLHPTPAVAGWPREPALAAIAILEDFDRGRYAGPVGWMDSRGDGDWAVGIRGATIKGVTAEVVAGAGIVAGSDPAAEWVETQAKFDPMLRALVRV